MKVFFDTSVLVAACVESHPAHKNSFRWAARARRGELDMVVATHTLAELYAVLTRLPARPKISPGTAARLIRENVEAPATIVSLSATDYRSVIKDLSERGIAGGTVYDALIAKAARRSSADRLLTFNPDDFERVWPNGTEIIHVP